MSRALLADLAWLPLAPDDLRQQLKTLTPETPAAGLQLRFLANHRLDNNQLTRLAKTAARLAAAGADLTKLKRVKLGLISNSTTSLIEPALAATAIRHGILLDLVECNYGQVVQEALDPASSLNRAKPDLVLLAIDWRGLPLRPAIGDAGVSEKAVAEAVDYLANIAGAIEANCGATVIVQTAARPAEHVFGSLDLRVAGTMRGLIDAFNRALIESLAGTSRVLFDVAALAENLGLAEWHDQAMWHTAKLPFSQAFVPLYADHVGRLMSAIKGGSRKCLVLDLDNTLWGGVIGDDGIDGIVLGQGSPTGEAYLAIQPWRWPCGSAASCWPCARRTKKPPRGCHFASIPTCCCGKSDIAVFQANWTDKAANLQRHRRDAVNSGSILWCFLDDNPAEREQVRQASAGGRGARTAGTIRHSIRGRSLAAGYFESIAFSKEDRERAEEYQNQRRPTRAAQSTPAIWTRYLASLDMVIDFAPVRRDRPRAHLAAHQQIQPVQPDDPALYRSRHRRDGAGAGRVHAAGATRRPFRRQRHDLRRDLPASARNWDIDTWLMSCRVLGRRVEIATLQEIARHARAAGSHLAARPIHPDRSQCHGQGSLRQARIYENFRRRGRRQYMAVTAPRLQGL